MVVRTFPLRKRPWSQKMLRIWRTIQSRVTPNVAALRNQCEHGKGGKGKGGKGNQGKKRQGDGKDLKTAAGKKAKVQSASATPSCSSVLLGVDVEVGDETSSVLEKKSIASKQTMRQSQPQKLLTNALKRLEASKLNAALEGTSRKTLPTKQSAM